MATIRCYDIYGDSVPVAPEALTFRPAVYGIFLNNNHILLMRHPKTDLLYPPGEILTPSQTPTQAIRHTFRRLLGTTPLLGPLLYVEDRYYLDESRTAWHLSQLYYALDRPTTMAALPQQADSDVDWIPLKELTREQLWFGYEAIKAGRLRLDL
ncbi:MAG: hypothetical protein D6706_00395 [Chloroflexi bacterium]|nr:MAG: hypothetical protein D6706_00395 [Chloroflexota bacterium]